MDPFEKVASPGVPKAPPRRAQAVFCEPTCAEADQVRAVHNAVTAALEIFGRRMHGSVGLVCSGFTLGNVVDVTDVNSFMMPDGSTPLLLGACLRIVRKDARVALPVGPPPMPLPGLSQAQLDALVRKNSNFVVVAVASAGNLALFTGVELTLVPMDRFFACFGPLYRTRAVWTLSQVCADVLASLEEGVDSLPRVVLFTQSRAACLKLNTEPHLLTSAFAFVFSGFPRMSQGDLRTVRRAPKPVSAVPAFFRNAPERGSTPGAAVIAWICSLARPGWRPVVPPGWMGPGLLRYYYQFVGTKTRDPVCLAVCRFILRTRHAALLALLNQQPTTDDGDLCAACHALRQSLVMEDEVGDACPSRFLRFLGASSGLERCTPWPWVTLFYRSIDKLIDTYEGLVCAPPARCKPVGLDAQALCGRVRQVVLPDVPRLPPCDATLAALMRVVECYLLVRWRPAMTLDPKPFFEDLFEYLNALRDPELCTFLCPRVWGFYAQCDCYLLPLAEHFLSPACVLGPVSWLVPEAVLRDIKPKQAPPRVRPDASAFAEVTSTRKRARRDFLNPAEGAGQARSDKPR
jgi:hypothetical protein